MFGHRYFAACYFAPRYFSPRAFAAGGVLDLTRFIRRRRGRF
jgi:hypothetical protein